MHVNLNRIRY